MRTILPPISSRRSSGMTLVELLMSFTILSIGVLGFIGAFLAVSKSIHYSKTRAVATNLLQEKIEALKNVSYYRLLPTTAPATSSESGIPAFQYDPSGGFYPPETLSVGDVSYTRRVFVEKVSSSGSGDPVPMAWQDPDSGLKRIRAYVIWQDGGNWKYLELHNLRNNPSRQFMTGTVSGTVGVSAGSPTEATVQVAQNASWYDKATSAGAYSFYVTPGSYTLTASLQGYFPQTVDNASVGSNLTYTWNPTLTRMSSGTVTGTAYLRDHLVLSRVVGSLDNGGFDQEYLEVYNPTTWTWTVGGDLSVYWQGRSPYLKTSVAYTTITNTIAPGAFYLFANTTTVRVGATNIPADAVWENTLGGANDVNANLSDFDMLTNDPNVIVVYEDGGGGGGRGVGAVELYSATHGTQDQLGWEGGGSGVAPGFYESVPYDQAQGINVDEQFRRFSTSAGYNALVAPAFDTNVNNSDWNLVTPVPEPPRYSGTTVQSPTTGTPANGAWVSVDDGLSDPSQCASTGLFTVTSVATGTWNVNFSSGALYYQGSATISSNGQTVSLGTVAITSTTTNGFITGTVRAAVSNSLLSGITVQDAAGATAVSGASGRYSMSLTPGLTSVTANPGNVSNASYVSETVNNVDVATGVFTTGIDFTLDTGGKIRGYVTIGSNPLPGVPATATDSGGIVAGESASDSNGYFTISNLSTGTYTVDLQLESGETYSPGSTSASLTTAGSTVFAATFSVTNAFGYITGSLTASGAALRTGVLVVATTGTISGSNPPDIDASLRSGTTKYYSASSFSDGTYELYVPGGNPGTPITYNLYAWYTTYSGTTPTVTKKTSTASVTGGATTSGRDFSW